ncbi:uncharacterized protein LOC143635368 [Bidens hawaiensis]|uniref:uncharacterized protein LOC143635368 n=1 Tax=Bidens hawaiensis TaxID=980011 RepID=UPI004049BA93
MAITTCSGMVLGHEVRRNEVEVEDEEVMDEGIEMEVPGKVKNTAPVAPHVEKKPVEVWPSPLVAHSPLQHMPKYAKFLKDPLKRKDRLGEVSSIPLMGDCSAVVLNRLPEKLSDPGVFMILCLFGSDAMSHALADLGASINLMPYLLYEKLELGELTPTCMSLSLADSSVKYPRGIIENLIVKVDKFVFPVDFVVLDMEAEEKVPIIPGRPFLRVDKCFDYICGTDLVGSNGLVDCDDLREDESCENDSVCDELAEISGLPEMIEVNEISCENEVGSKEKPGPLELKVLPSYLEYAYLDEGSNLTVIVSSKLTEEEKSKLIYVLKLHKGRLHGDLLIFKD